VEKFSTVPFFFSAKMYLKTLTAYKAFELFEVIIFFFMKLFGNSNGPFETFLVSFSLLRIVFQLVRLTV